MRRKNSVIRSILFYAVFSLVLCIAPAVAASLIDINTASQAELTTLKGIGPVKAQAIIDYREAHPFYSIEDIKQVKGIGDATFAAIKDFITVGDITPPPKASAVSAPKKSSASKSAVSKTPRMAQTAAVEASNQPYSPVSSQTDALWTTALGLAALVTLGVGGALYVRNPKTALTARETAPTADEFEIE